MNSEFQGASWTLCSSRYLVKIALVNFQCPCKTLAPGQRAQERTNTLGVYRKRQFSNYCSHFFGSVLGFLQAPLPLLPATSSRQSASISGSFQLGGRLTSGTFHQSNSALSLVSAW